jgi:hypothetical protein
MKQTLSLTPSAARLGLDPWFLGSSLVITGTIPSTPEMGVWAMQLWNSQWDLIEDATATPLATAIGSVTSGVLTIGFTPSQLSDITLSSTVGLNNFWLVIGGQDTDGSQQIIRAGTIEIVPCPWSTTSITNSVGITVSGDWATFTYDGVQYRFPVAAVATPPVAPDGIAVDNDTAYIDYNSDIFSAPVEEIATPPEAVEGELVVVDDNLIVLLDGVAYTIPVEQVP